MEAKKKSWTSALFAYAEGEKSRLLLSVVLSVLSVMLGLVPFYCMYRLICLMAAGTATAALAVKWCLLALASLVTFPLSFLCMGLTFKITGKEKDEVLHGIDLTLPEGSFTALVGPSGGGKSTVAKLIARFWDVTSGAITIGGVNVKDMPLSQLSEYVSFVTQDNFLFRCSLLENIRLGNPSATDEEVKAAARAAQCEEFISKLPQGYDTPAGEAGKRLSGGEKQRIAIARMMLKNAPIVILDEATASIDPENEHLIQQAISALTRGKTIITIAHCLATVQNADQILVVDDGRIAHHGTHDQLVKQEGLYQRFTAIRQQAEGWRIAAE